MINESAETMEVVIIVNKLPRFETVVGEEVYSIISKNLNVNVIHTLDTIVGGYNRSVSDCNLYLGDDESDYRLSDSLGILYYFAGYIRAIIDDNLFGDTELLKGLCTMADLVDSHILELRKMLGNICSIR